MKILLMAALAAAVLAAGVAGRRIWNRSADPLPAHIAYGNGRLEAREYDVATKLSGRLAELSVREGDTVEAGQVVGRLDTAELQAQLRETQAQQRQAAATVDSARMQLRQRESELAVARREFARIERLYQTSAVSTEQLDRVRLAQVSAAVAVDSARSQIALAQAGQEAAQATADRVAGYLADTDLRSPVSGRVLYRLAEPGEVLGAGGRIATVLDLSDVSMTIFLSTAEAGRLPIGSEARIVLDAAPEYVFPATVSFVSPEAQFTPKEVETRSERDKLMFRVKLQVDRALLERYAAQVKTGLPGMGYVRTRSSAAWPATLTARLPP